ncbi:MAG: UvrD-helicase domain-containing protein [Bacteroidaceae bacterium]|nr:UvrD-helicase domain-containing protein [Bacteroidaceae bacterium]
MEQSLSIYKASAGSGKTFALAVEYITGLLLPHAEREFEHTLAVTFTNKATAEMKDRILETLYGLKMNLEDARPYLDAIMKRFDEAGIAITPEQIRRQAGKALAAILHDYSHFRVETIDSFFQSILRNMARELGLAANLQVELSHDEVIDSAVDSLIETMDERPDVKDWVLSYIREQLDSGDKWDIAGPLKDFAANIFREEYQRRSEAELMRISDADVIKDFKGKMMAIRNRAKKEVEEAVDDIMSQISDYSQISYGKNLYSFLLKSRAMESDGPGKSVLNSKFKNQGSNTFDLQARLAEFTSLYKERRREYLSATLALRHLGPLRLLRHIDQRAREIEGDAGRFTLSSTPALLSKMVEGSDAPFIFEKIGTYINNVMIDEFQDTSLMQWENFKKLLFEKLASGGKGLLVGDIKQSIYRWRNGDWKILYGIENEPVLKRFDIKPKLLDINYRSHQVVVDFNNAFFPMAARKLDGIEPNADIELSGIYSDVEQKAKKEDGKGYVRVRLYKETDNYIQDTVTDMAEQIRRLQAGGLGLSQIAILVRTNLMARQLIDGFAEYAPDIRLVSDEAFLLEASTSVQMLVAALRMLVDKNHSDGISEKYLMLHYLRDVLGKEDTTIQSIALTEAEQVLPKEFTENKDELLQLPLYLLAEKLWRIFSLAGIEGEDIYALTFFDELQNHLRSAAAPDIQTFLTAWDEKLSKCSVTGSTGNGVRILTIHKSKGLAFHTVMLPFSHWDIERDRQGDVLWCSTDKAPFNELGALPISIQSKAVRTSVFAPDYEEEHLERRVDALNTLYVAFTRAIANLYVWGKTKANTAGELIYSTLSNDENDTSEEVFYYETGSPLTEIKHEDKKNLNRLHLEHQEKDAIDVKVVTRNPALYFQQSNLAQDYLKEQTTDKQSSTTEGKVNGQQTTDIKLSGREVGKRMHEVLSRINDVGQFDEMLLQARQEGIVGEDKDWDVIVESIKEGLSNPLIASWFKPENIIYNECAIASIDEEKGLPQVLRPDRVVMKDGNITVIDYKFGHPNHLYYDQVKEYMNLMKQMYPKHNVQGYIWYVMRKRAVQVHSS